MCIGRYLYESCMKPVCHVGTQVRPASSVPVRPHTIGCGFGRLTHHLLWFTVNCRADSYVIAKRIPNSTATITTAAFKSEARPENSLMSA